MSDTFAKQPTPLPPGVKTPGKDDEIIERRTLRDYYIILRERLWIALPLALTVALGLIYYQSRETPMYRSLATMHFDKSEVVLNQNSKVYNPDVENEVMLNTYITMIRSDTLKNQVRASLSPEDQKVLLKPFLKDLPPGATPPSVDIAMASPFVQQARNNFIIEISVAHRDPDAAALLTNRYVDQFIQMLLNKVGSSNDDALVFLRRRSAELQAQAEASDKKLSDYMGEHKLGISLDTSTNVVSSRLMVANTDLQRARMDHRTVQDQLALIERYQQEKRNLLEISFIAGYGSVPDLRKQLEAMQRDQAIKAETLLERHPKMIELASSIAVVQDQLDSAINLAIADLKTSLSRAATIEQKQQAEYDAQEKELLHLRELSVSYKVLADEKDADHKNFVEINDRLAQIVNNKYLESVPVSRLDSAHPNPVPYSPNLSSIVKTAVGIGVLVFFGVAVGLSFVDDRIKSAWDVETFIGANLLGIIPDLFGDHASGASECLHGLQEPARLVGSPGSQLEVRPLAGEQRPCPTDADAVERRAVRVLAVAVAVVPVPARPAGQLDAQQGIDRADRRDDARIVGRPQAEAHQGERVRAHEVRGVHTRARRPILDRDVAMRGRRCVGDIR